MWQDDVQFDSQMYTHQDWEAKDFEPFDAHKTGKRFIAMSPTCTIKTLTSVWAWGTGRWLAESNII